MTNLINPEAERGVLGAMILSPELAGEGIAKFTDMDFGSGLHRLIFDVIKTVYIRDGGVEVLALMEELKNRKRGSDYNTGVFLDIAADVSSPGAWQHHVKIVKDYSIRRSLSSLRDTINQGFNNCRSGVELLEDAVSAVLAIRSEGVKDWAAVGEEGKVALSKMLDAKGTIPGLPSGWVPLDSLISGFWTQEMYVIAAYPGMGKTAFALNIAKHLSIDGVIPGAILSLEMATRDLIYRFLSSHIEVENHYVRIGALNEEEWERAGEYVTRMERAPLYILDNPALSITQIAANARRAKAMYGIKYLIVDYLQLGRGDGETKQQQVAAVATGLKNIAKDLDIPVIATSQLNRAGRGTGRPGLQHLRETGQIEQDADSVLFLHSYVSQEEMNKRDNIEMVVYTGKNRHGPLADIAFTFQRKYVRFVVGEPETF